MFNISKNQNKWLKFIPTGTFFEKTKNYLGSFSQLKIKNNKFEIFHWIKLWFFIKYSIISLKNSISSKFSILIVSDYKKTSKTIANIAKQFNFFFAAGSWEGGRLTKTFWYKYSPAFVIIFGSLYPKNLYNELKILGIPNVNLTEHFTFKNKISNSYLIPFCNQQITSFKKFTIFFTYNIYKLCYIPFLEHWIIKKAFNPFYYQILKAIQFKIHIFIKKNKKIKKNVLEKKKNSNFNLFSVIFLNLNKRMQLSKLKIAYYNKWNINKLKKYKIQNNIKKKNLYYLKTNKNIYFSNNFFWIEMQQQNWLSAFSILYKNERK